MEDAAHKAAEAAARASYGRLVAMLAAATRDIAAAEDVLSEAFASALAQWPAKGVPDNPEGWLLTAARNRMHNARRHQKVRDQGALEIEQRYSFMSEDEAVFPDERLKLMFICAHPAINDGVRTPLMLQTVLGISAERIAAAFLVPPATMGQRLVRAKLKIRDAGIRFAIPEPEQMRDRLADVLDAVYTAYGAGWDDLDGSDATVRSLTLEAIYLGRLIVTLLPKEPEPMGLLSMMLHCEARKHARRDKEGRFVPLRRQDHQLWSRDMIIEAEQHLTTASRFGQYGRYQCEAAIQSLHAQRAITGVANHKALITLYDLLARHSSSIGVSVSRAAVLLDAGEAAKALEALETLPAERIRTYQPYWVAKTRAFGAAGRREEAANALARALELTQDSAVRAFLENDAAPDVPNARHARQNAEG